MLAGVAGRQESSPIAAVPSLSIAAPINLRYDSIGHGPCLESQSPNCKRVLAATKFYLILFLFSRLRSKSEKRGQCLSNSAKPSLEYATSIMYLALSGQIRIQLGLENRLCIRSSLSNSVQHLNP